VDVCRTICVMSRENSLEHNDTLLVALLDTTEPRCVKVRRISAVSIAVRHNAGVYTNGVTVPELKESLRYRLTGIDIDDLDVEREWNTCLSLSHILAHELALDPVRSLGRLGSEDAGVVASERN
jgi:hypothetical protein